MGGKKVGFQWVSNVRAICLLLCFGVLSQIKNYFILFYFNNLVLAVIQLKRQLND